MQTDPVLWRGIERLVIALGAILFGFLGYRLYRFGVESGRGKLDFKSAFVNFALSGTGPGLFFMAFGSCVLIAALFNGGGSNTSIEGEKVSEQTNAQTAGIVRYRRTIAQSNSCIQNLRQVEGAKEQYALEMQLKAGEKVEWSVLSTYLKAPDELTCADGGKYELNAIGVDAVCSVHGSTEQ